MVKRTAPETEPEESVFEIPSEKEHLLQVTDYQPLREGDIESDNIFIVKLEVVGGDESGLTMLNRVNIDDTEKSFYFARLFLKAIGEGYKGSFDIEPDRWIGRQFYATVKHSQSKGKTYANIDTYNFDKKIQQVYQAPVKTDAIRPEDIAWGDDNIGEVAK
jgi:hypothetical protein